MPFTCKRATGEKVLYLTNPYDRASMTTRVTQQWLKILLILHVDELLFKGQENKSCGTRCMDVGAVPLSLCGPFVSP